MELEKAPPKPSRIRTVRLDAGLSQTSAAAIVMVSLRTWQNWEAGQHEMNPILWKHFRESIAHKQPKQPVITPPLLITHDLTLRPKRR